MNVQSVKFQKNQKMKNTLYLILLVIGSTFTAQAQSTEEAKVTEVVNNLFKAMYTNDTTLFKSVFSDQVTMATVMKRGDNVVLQRDTGIKGFVKAISKPNPKGALTEEIWNVKVQIDGDFAQVWCDYAFYVGHTLSHCGVDAFHLVKTTDGWKVFHLADTRRKDCTIPQNILDKHK